MGDRGCYWLPSLASVSPPWGASTLGDFWGLECTRPELCHGELGDPGGEEGSTNQDLVRHEGGVPVGYPGAGQSAGGPRTQACLLF